MYSEVGDIIFYGESVAELRLICTTQNIIWGESWSYPDETLTILQANKDGFLQEEGFADDQTLFP